MMIKSMTAYGRASVSAPSGKMVVELHSVNRKMLDMTLYLPKDFLCFDIEVRKWLAQHLERGQVTLRLTFQSDRANDALFSRYLVQLKYLKQGWQKLCSELGYDPTAAIDLPFLVSQLPSVPVQEFEGAKEEVKSALKQAIDSALVHLMEMKEAEGEMLAVDIRKRLAMIEEAAAAVERNREAPLEHYRKKLRERLEEIGHLDREERIDREIVLLAEKMDITEEIVRLRTLIEQFYRHLLTTEKSVGRTLDFLTQEMHREINTLGSKSSDSAISLHVVKLKAELDKIREQVQNIE